MVHVDKKITRWDQLKASLKFHFLRKIRRPYASTVEVLFPMSFVVICLVAAIGGDDADGGRRPFKHVVLVHFPTFLTFFLGLVIPFMLRSIIEEKEEDLKGLMSIMGLKKSVYWAGWAVTYTLEILVITIVGCVPIALLMHKGYGMAFILLFGLAMSMQSIALMMSTFQTKSTAAVLWGLTVVYVMAIITALIVEMYQGWDWLFTFLPSAAFACAWRLLDALRDKGFGEAMASKDYHDVPLGGYVGFMYGQAVLYFIFAVWLDGVVPSEFGIHRDPWYCFKRQHKKPTPEEKKIVLDEDHESREPLPSEKKRDVAVSIQKVSKDFNKRCKETCHALKDITLHFCEGEIIALVGGNSCGKTTLLRILTGVNRPTSGTARLMGCDTSNHLQMSTVRPFLGVCRQYDVAFKYMTVYEHLEYFARLKGAPAKKIPKRIRKLTKAVDLDNHRDTPFYHLPKGNRRKLCFLMAYIGDPKILLLDDPSSALDPISRRKMWALLKRDQEDRTVIISSHYLNDVNALADQTVILEKGRIKCSGSTEFLLRRYSRGYHLRFTLKHKSELAVGQLEKIIKTMIPASEIGKYHGNELSFILPLSEKKSYGVLFDRLDKEVQKNDAIIDYGLSTPTLEHIFYGFHKSLIKEEGKLPDSLAEREAKEANKPVDERRSDHSIKEEDFDVKVDKTGHFCQEFRALAALRFIKKSNDVCTFTPLVLLPMLILLFTVVFLNLSGKFSFLPQAMSFNGGNILHALASEPRPTDSSTTASPASNGRKLGPVELATSAAILVGVSFALIPAGLMIEYIDDREIGARKLLYIVGSSPAAYFLSFAPFYGLLMITVTVYYACILGAVKLAVVSDAVIIVIQMAIILLVTVPSFLFVLTLSHVFPRALTLTAYFLVLLTGVVPFCIVAHFISKELNSEFRIAHIAFAFVSPLYIPFGMGLVVYHQTHMGKDLGKPEVYCLFIACVVHFAWIGLLWVADLYINGKPLCENDEVEDAGAKDEDPDEVPAPNQTYAVPAEGAAGGVPAEKTAGGDEGSLASDPKTKPVGDDDGGSVSQPKKPEASVQDQTAAAATATTGEEEATTVTRPDPAVVGADILGEGLRSSLTNKPFEHDSSAVLEAVHVGKNFEHDLCGPQEKRRVLKDFSVSIKQGELVCLVGRNGSGKTTLTKLLIGEEKPTKGTLTYRGKPLWQSDIFNNLGYSPEEGLWKYVTVEQHLKLYASLKGVDEGALQRHVDQFMRSMDFEHERHRCVIRCASGTKKKINDAICLIGNPDIIILDEPTTGLDAFSKRLVWDFLLQYCGGVKTVIMTTPSLEEAEALGTHIGILEDGILGSYGSYEDLKKAGEKHFTLKIRLKVPESVPAQKKQLADVLAIAPGTKFQERFISRFVFDIAGESGVTIRKIYTYLEQRRDSLGIIQYSVSNNTLGAFLF